MTVDELRSELDKTEARIMHQIGALEERVLGNNGDGLITRVRMLEQRAKDGRDHKRTARQQVFEFGKVLMAAALAAVTAVLLS